MSWKKKNDISNSLLLEEYKNGSMDARDKLIDFFKKNALDISREYYNLGVSEEDIIQSSYEGVILGVDKSRDIKSSNISSNVIYYIRRTIEVNILAYYGIYIEYTNTSIIKKVIDVLKARRDLKSDDVEKISEYLGKNVNYVKDILDFLYGKDYVVFNQYGNLEDYYLDKERLEEVSVLLKERLDEKQLKILYFRLGLGLSLRDIASRVNLTFQRCQQIEKDTMKKVRKIVDFVRDKGENKKNFGLMKLSDVRYLCKQGDSDALLYLIDYYFPRIINVIDDFVGFNYSKEELSLIVHKSMVLSLNNDYSTYNMLIFVKNSIIDSIICRYGFSFVSNFSFEGKVRVLKMLKAKEDFISEFGYSPSDDELSSYMNFDLKLVSDMKKLIK